MVKEGIMLSHQILKKRIKDGKAEIKVIEKFPAQIFLKGIRRFLVHTGFTIDL